MSPTFSNAPPRTRGGALSFLSLFTSLGTLLCCALALAARVVRTRGNGCHGALGSSVAGRPVPSQALGVHRGRAADFQQFRLRLRDRSEAASEKRGLRPERPGRVPDGQPFQSDCALVLGGVVSGRLLHRVHSRATTRSVRLARRKRLLRKGSAGNFASRFW